MDQSAILALIAATAVLVSIPGPNVALFVANTLAHGMRHGAVTVLGTTLGVALQLTVVVLGLAVVLQFAAWGLSWLKWAGVFYLLYLGYASWRRGVSELCANASSAPLHRLFWQGLLLALVNPKTLLFSAAFLPQFVPTQTDTPWVLLMPATIYLGVVFLGDLCWVASAEAVRPFIARLGRLRHRLTGCLFVVSGVGLAFARIER